MIHEKLIELLKKQCSEGDFTLLETVILNIHERPLLMGLPKEIKSLLLTNLKGQDCYIVKLYTREEILEERFIDFIDALAFLTINEDTLLPGEKVELLRGVVVFGNMSYFEYEVTSTVKRTFGLDGVPHEAPKA